MLKAIFYIFLIYIAYKFYKLIKNGSIVYRSYHYHDNRSYEEQKEGEVHIKENPAKKVTGSQGTKSGDYIDFEEIKD